MKAYGHSRTDGQSCKYGCCTGKTDKRKVGRAQGVALVVRRHARRMQKNAIFCKMMAQSQSM